MTFLSLSLSLKPSSTSTRKLLWPSKQKRKRSQPQFGLRKPTFTPNAQVGLREHLLVGISSFYCFIFSIHIKYYKFSSLKEKNLWKKKKSFPPPYGIKQLSFVNVWGSSLTKSQPSHVIPTFYFRIPNYPSVSAVLQSCHLFFNNLLKYIITFAFNFLVTQFTDRLGN